MPLVLLTASFAGAQTPSAGEANKSRIEGIVVGLNKEVIPRATLRLQIGLATPSYSAVSGEDGRFAFEGVSPGGYTLTASKDGLTQRYGTPVPTGSGVLNEPTGIVLSLAGGEVLKDLSIQMTRPSVVSGRVSSREGDPVVGVRVDVLRYEFRNARRVLVSVGNQRTNDLSEFRIAGLSPGRYYLVATTSQQTGTAEAESNITTFYPSARDVLGAAPLDIPAGSELRGMDIRLQKALTYAIRGKAVGADLGQLKSRLHIQINRNDIPDWRNDGVFVNAAGEFEFRGLPPGRYLLSLPFTAASINLIGQMEVTVSGSDVNNVVMEVGPRPRVTGLLEMEDGSRARVRGTVSLNPINSSSGFTASISGDGTFEHKSLQAGKYSVGVSGLSDETYIKSVEFNGQAVTHLALNPGSSGTMRIVLSAPAAHVSDGCKTKTAE